MLKPQARLHWRGAETIREIAERLVKREKVTVLLPHGFHHALCVRVAATERAHDLLDVTLDKQTFDQLTRIRGLRQLAELKTPLEEAGMEVRVRTPPPQLLFAPATKRRRHSAHRYRWEPAGGAAPLSGGRGPARTPRA
jgi:hypothetical protein